MNAQRSSERQRRRPFRVLRRLADELDRNRKVYSVSQKQGFATRAERLARAWYGRDQMPLPLRACRTEFEGVERWRGYLERASQQEADIALAEVIQLEKSFEHKHPPTSQRMHALFDAGVEVYEQRFGVWVPF